MSDLVKSFGFSPIPTALIALLLGGNVYFIKLVAKHIKGQFDHLDLGLDRISADLQENNRLTKACSETSRLLLLEKMRFFVAQNDRTTDKDLYFQSLYQKFEDLGNGDDSGILKAWQAKPLSEGKNA